MGVNKVVYGTTVLVDLTNDTITNETVAKGYTGHDKTGAAITGTLEATGTGSVVWRKYEAVTKWEYTESASLGQTAPSDMDTSHSYGGFEINNDGYFELYDKTNVDGYYLKKGTENGKTKQIYREKWNFVLGGDSYDTYHLLTVADTSTGEIVKGERLLGYVSADSSSAYPTDGEQDGYWYVKVENSGTSPNLQSKSITPTATTQTVQADSGYDGLSQVTVNGDTDFKAENIKEGINIFGVLGTLKTSSGGKQVKTGTITDQTTIETGLSSIDYFILYKTGFAETGLIIAIHDVSGGSTNGVGCSSYSTWMKTCAALNSSKMTITGGSAKWNGTSTGEKLSSGKQYNWIAIGN